MHPLECLIAGRDEYRFFEKVTPHTSSHPQNDRPSIPASVLGNRPLSPIDAAWSDIGIHSWRRVFYKTYTLI